MESTSGFKQRYWRRHKYQRLDGTGNSNMKVARLGGKKKRSWRIRAIPKLKLNFKILSPIRLFKRLRDSYVNMMLGLEGRVGALQAGNTFGVRKISLKEKKSKKISKAEAFEAKLIFEIYKSLQASRELASHRA